MLNAPCLKNIVFIIVVVVFVVVIIIVTIIIIIIIMPYSIICNFIYMSKVYILSFVFTNLITRIF